MNSCSLFESFTDSGTKKRSHQRHRGKVTKIEKDQEKKVDTIKVELIENADVIKDDDLEEVGRGVHKEHYTIEIVLPVVDDAVSDSDRRLSSRNERYMQYYLGARIAAEQLDKSGVKLKVVVRDAMPNLDGDKFYDELEETYRTKRPDIILGGSSREQIKALVDFSKRYKCTGISPFVPYNGNTVNNDYFIQLAPSLDAYLEAIVKDIHQHHKDADVYLLAHEEFEGRLNAIQKYRDEIFGDEMAWTQFVFTDDKDIETIKSLGYSSESKEQVFVIPMDYDRVFLYKLLTKIFSLRNSRDFIIYGLPPWDQLTILYEFYDGMNVFIPTMNYIDKESDNYSAFQEEYYKKYSAIPDIDAVKGYDEMIFIGRMVQKFGLPFAPALPEISYQGLSSNYEFQRVEEESSALLFDRHLFHYIENRGLRMWRLSP